jgi:hypothetical protein
VERDDGIAGIVLAAEQALEVEQIEGGFDLRELLCRLLRRLLARLFRQLEVDLGVLQLGELLTPARERRRQRRAFAENRLCFLAVAPEFGSRRRLVQLSEPRFSLSDVKDTSRTRSGGLPGSWRVPSAHSARYSWRQQYSRRGG